MELWDGYFKDGSKADITLIRGNPIPKGIYHMASEVLVRHTDGDFLIMQRDPSKKLFPGYYEATAGGSALKGEDKLACVKRELKEETGIDCSSFKEVDSIVSDANRTIYYVFYCETDCDKNSIKLQQGETCAYAWVNASELKRLLKEGKICPGNAQRLPQSLIKTS